MIQDENGLLTTNFDGKPFDSRLDAIKYTLAYYRVSQECIQHALYHYSEADVAMAIEVMGNPLAYEAEPDHRLLMLLKAITHIEIKMPPHIPNSHLKIIKKSNPEMAARNMVKIQNMMKNKGKLVTCLTQKLKS